MYGSIVIKFILVPSGIVNIISLYGPLYAPDVGPTDF